MLLRLYRDYRFHLLLLVIAIYGFAQLSFMANTMKWDILDCTFPLQYLISEDLRHGLLPLWNPYQSLGLPIYADPSVNTWYPITWLISIVHGYDFYAVNFQFVLHIFIAGLGMFTLGRTLKLGNFAAFLMAVSYMFCGLFVGNAQHLLFVISAAWIPFVLSSFFQMLEIRQTYYTIKTGFFIYMLFTGGYIAFTVIIAYMLFAIFLYHVVNSLLAKRRNELTALVKQGSIMASTALLLSLVLVVSLYQALPFFTRGNALEVDKIMENSFTLKSFASFIFPYAVTTDVPWWGTDLSMSNAYFGLIALFLLLYTPFVKRNGRQLMFLAFGVFCLAASLGNELPVRKWLFDYLPAMNMFRHPALFRYFAILGFAIAFGYTANEVLNNLEQHKRRLVVFSAIAVLLLGLVVAANLITTNEGILAKAISTTWNATWPSGMDKADHIFVHGFFQLLILAGFFLAVYLLKSVKRFAFAVACLFTVEMIISTQLNLPATVIYPIKLSEAQAALDTAPEGFPVNNTKRMIDILDNKPSMQIPALWTNLNVFTKETSCNGYNPFKLNQYDKFAGSPLVYAVLSNKLVYLADKVLPVNKLNTTPINSNSLFFDSADYTILSKTGFATIAGDAVEITDFKPNRITAHSKTQAPQIVTLLQTNFPGWKVHINGKPTETYTSNIAFVSAVLPAGENTIEFIYKPVMAVAAMWVSWLALVTCLAYFVYETVRRRRLQAANV